jgi:hypothetical protein
MTDHLGRKIKNQEQSTYQGNGLYTNPLNDYNLNPRHPYNLIINCTNPTTRWWTAISQLIISTEETVRVGAETTVIEGCTREDGMFGAIQYYICQIQWFIARMTTSLYEITHYITTGQWVTDYTGAGRWIQEITRIQATPLRIIYLLFTDPMAAAAGIMGIWYNFLALSIVAIGFPFLVWEMYVLYTCCTSKTGIGMIKVFFEEHLKVFNWLFDKTINVLRVLSNLIPGT